MKTVILFLALGSVALTAPRRDEMRPHAQEREKPVKSDMNIPELAEQLGLTTLLGSLKKVGLAGAFSGPGPFTLLAPNNEAFQRLPAGVADNITVLKDLLLYHGIRGDLPTSQMNQRYEPSFLADHNIIFNVYEFWKDRKVVTAEGSQIILADQNASNGVIHVLKRVMQPPAAGTIAAFLASPFGKNFTKLIKAIEAANLVGYLSTYRPPLTLFAPTDQAFAKIPKETLDNLLKNKSRLATTFFYHIVWGAEWSAGLSSHDNLYTTEGGYLTVNITNSEPDRNPEIIIGYKQGSRHDGRARVVRADIPAANGVIHAINTVMLLG